MGLLYTHRDHLIVCVPLSPIQRRVPILHHIDREGEMVLPPPLLIYTQGLWPPPLYLTLFLWWMSAPLSNSTSTMERCPFQEAEIRAVDPHYTT